MISRIAIIEAALVSALTKIVDDLNTGKRKPRPIRPSNEHARRERDRLRDRRHAELRADIENRGAQS
jgi:hypothetical protein